MLRNFSRPFVAPIRKISTTSGHEEEADIVIVGGGMVGSSLGAALGRNPVFRNRKILLLEGAPKKGRLGDKLPPDVFSNRVSALNPASSSFLEKIGAWKHVEKMGRCRPFTRMFVWDECSPGSIEFNGFSDPDNQTGIIAQMVENDVTVDSLTKALDETENVEVKYSANIENCQLSEDKLPILTLDKDRKITCQLLIGADGANSIVRRAMGNHYFSKDYQQMGVVGTITFEEPFKNDTAYQKFMKTGPIAFLPLSPQKSSLVWTVPRSMVGPLKDLDPEQFACKLNEQISYQSSNPLVEAVNMAVGRLLSPKPALGGSVRPPRVKRVDNIAAFPLGTGLPERAVSSKRAVLVGDAFHRVHPLAGQGVNLGFGDAECLVHKLSDGVRSGRVLGDYETLCDYETKRLRHNLPTMAAINGLQKLYCTDNPLFVLARSVGIQFVNSSTTLKNIAVSQAS